MVTAAMGNGGLAEAKLAADAAIMHNLEEEGVECSEVRSNHAHEEVSGEGGFSMGMGWRAGVGGHGRVAGHHTEGSLLSARHSA